MNRTIIVIFILALCLVDLVATYYYIYTYKQWQPNKPYDQIELNPLLRFLWNQFGFHMGMLIGAVLILALNYIVSKEAHWAIVLVLGLFLCWAMFNHFNNISLLHQLIEKYPSGYLPTETFGKVVGNNIN